MGRRKPKGEGESKLQKGLLVATIILLIAQAIQIALEILRK
jgi:hypothetical protein